MTLAHKIDLDVALVQYRAIKETRFVLIERYERVRAAKALPERADP